MRRTVLTTPVICDVLRLIALFFCKLLGWKLPRKVSDLQKGVMIGAPHTSNWDFMVMLMAVLIWRLDVSWVGKHTLFMGPLGPLMRWLGGVPIDRRSKQNFVQQMVAEFANREHLLLLIAPEGTRSPVEKWRTGFYFIAHEAGVPIIMSYVDYKDREVGIADIVMPTGNAEVEVQKMQDFYATKHGRHPDNYSGHHGG